MTFTVTPHLFVFVTALQNGSTAAEVALTNEHNDLLAILGMEVPLTEDSTDDLEVKMIAISLLCSCF